MLFRSQAADSEYLSDGITESLIGNLSQLPNLKVMSRAAVFRYKGKAVDPKAFGREMGVQALLTGRVTQRGNEMEVSAELINVSDESELWGEQYRSRSVNDALTVQKDIAHQIVETLKLHLSSGLVARMESYQTTNPKPTSSTLKDGSMRANSIRKT